MKQLAINYEARALSRRDDPASSMRAAAKMVRSGRNWSDCSLVLATIETHPGLTAERIGEIAGIVAYTVRKRTADLRRRKLAFSRLFPGEPVLRWFPGEDPDKPREGA